MFIHFPYKFLKKYLMRKISTNLGNNKLGIFSIFHFYQNINEEEREKDRQREKEKEGGTNEEKNKFFNVQNL